MLGMLGHHGLDEKERFFSSAPPLQFNNIDIGGEGGEHVIEAATFAKERFFARNGPRLCK